MHSNYFRFTFLVVKIENIDVLYILSIYLIVVLKRKEETCSYNIIYDNNLSLWNIFIDTKTIFLLCYRKKIQRYLKLVDLLSKTD